MATKLDALMRKTQKDHGGGSFRFASDTRAADVRRIPTGITALDFATGGGIPVGRMTMIYGKKSAGKTSLCAKIIANAQRLCRRCYGRVVTEAREVEVPRITVVPETGEIVETREKAVKEVSVDCVNRCRVQPEGAKKKSWPGRLNVVYIDSEGAFDVKFYTQFGVDCDAETGGVRLAITDYGEQAVDIADAAIRTGECDLLVVDSLAHLTPMKEREASAEDQQMALQARLINKAMRDWGSSLNELEASGESDCAVVLINQIRMKVGIFPVEVLPGGMGQEFATSLDIRLRKNRDEKEGFTFDTSGRPLWMATEFDIQKNKTGFAKMRGFYRMCLTPHPGRAPGDTWDDEAVLDAAKSNGFVLGAGVQKPGDKVTVLGREFTDEDALRAELHARGDFYWTLRERVLALMIARPSDGAVAENKKGHGEVSL